MTAGVYGVVAGIVKLDDLGLYLGRRTGNGLGSRLQRAIGAGILRVAPSFMKFLSVAGTIAMFLVGGGILTHGIPPLHHGIERIEHMTRGWGSGIGALGSHVLEALTGVVGGLLLLAVVTMIKRARLRSAQT
ncbi:Membrane protein, putative [Labilithrix luteola]|uniref:Membrane protein, putative n=1 Tax=Labilithrix luteola TaxID=1391654 RepID=A0A0K1Q1I5_9BACT|nr:Membrane protein, putative [Labilithrix luteola]